MPSGFFDMTYCFNNLVKTNGTGFGLSFAPTPISKSLHVSFFSLTETENWKSTLCCVRTTDIQGILGIINDKIHQDPVCVSLSCAFWYREHIRVN